MRDSAGHGALRDLLHAVSDQRGVGRVVEYPRVGEGIPGEEQPPGADRGVSEELDAAASRLADVLARLRVRMGVVAIDTAVIPSLTRFSKTFSWAETGPAAYSSPGFRAHEGLGLEVRVGKCDGRLGAQLPRRERRAWARRKLR